MPLSTSRVPATGLFAEHYQKHNVVWNGENGRVVFFQNELPYDPPEQDAYRWAAYKVSDRVAKHDAWGAASYVFFTVAPPIHASRAFEVPIKPGIRMHDLLTVNLGAATIDHVVNDSGDPVTKAAIGATVRAPGSPGAITA